MKRKQTAVVRRIALSAVVIALYFVVMLTTAEFSFGVYQIRIATAFYALALPFPFLVLPLGIANCLSNVLGGMAWDIAGGFLVGLITAGVCAVSGKLPGRFKYPPLFAAIEFAPALIVPLWLAPTLGVPYWTLAASLLVGQLLPAALGALLVFALEKRFRGLNLYVFGFTPAAGREKTEIGAEDENRANDQNSSADQKQTKDQIRPTDQNREADGIGSAEKPGTVPILNGTANATGEACTEDKNRTKQNDAADGIGTEEKTDQFRL